MISYITKLSIEIWQGPEHWHIDFCKSLASCTNKKDVLLCILRWHVCAEHLQYLRSWMRTQNYDNRDGYAASTEAFNTKRGLKDEPLSCELGIRYQPCRLSCLESASYNKQYEHTRVV